MYHGDRAKREEIFKTKIMRHLKNGRPTAQFPVVCTSYEMVLKDQHNLSRINWEFIIIVGSVSALFIGLANELYRMKAIA